MPMRAGPDALPRSVERVLDLLELVVVGGSTNLTAIAAAADLTPTTALRYLRALDARGYVVRDEAGRYSAGPTVARLVQGMGETGVVERLVLVATPVLDDLAARTGESAYLAVADADGATATYLATAESPRAIRHVGWVGQQVPLDGTAVGAALATPGAIRARTGAVEPDITALSLAVPAAGPTPVAISIVGPRHRLRGAGRRAAEEALARAVEDLAQRLGVVAPAGSPAAVDAAS